MKKYEILRTIGDGTYGIVYEGINKEKNQKVAIKKLKQKYNTLEECLSKIEVKVLEKLNHENIVQLKEVIKDKKGQVSYVFEYCDCNLYEFIESHREYKKHIPEQIIREIVFQITRGIKYMHSNQYFHRDLKPENILLILNNYNLNNMVSGEIKVKICDFGTSKEITTNNILPMTQYVCTRWYRPPECVLRNDFYDEKMDVWAIGCIMAELYNLSAIFPGENEFDQLHQILKILGTPTRRIWPWGYYQTELFGIQLPIYYKKDFKKILGYISKEGVNLLNEIFIFDPAKRPSSNKILNHPYFRAIHKQKININPISLRTSSKKNNYGVKADSNNKYSKNQKNNYNPNDRINSNITKINDINDNLNETNKNRKNISQNKNNSNIIRRIDTQKTNNRNIELNHNKNTSTNKIELINGRYITKDIQNNYKTNYKNIGSINGKKISNINKYVKVNEIKSGLVTKKRYTRNNEESKINDKKELNIHRIERIGRNERNHLSSNDKKKFSFIYNTKNEKEESRNKSIDIISNIRKNFSSRKNKSKYNVEEDNKINYIEKFNNYKIINIVYNDNNIYKNHKEHYINNKANTNRRNINKSNTKITISGNNYERNSENNNNKILLRTKNLTFYKNKCKNNHKFYISKYNNLKNQKYIITNNYHTYNENTNRNDNNHKNKCTCSLGRNYSGKRNLIYNKDFRHNIKNNYNIRIIEDYSKENKTPKNNKTKNHYRSIPKSPLKQNNNINSLFSSFINTKNDEKNSLFLQRQSLTKGNNSTINIHYESEIKKNNYSNYKNKIKNLNMEVNEENNNFYINKNYTRNSTSKKENYKTNKN